MLRLVAGLLRVAAAACAGLITLGIMHGMWYGPVMKALGDPPAGNPHYHVWRTGWQIAAPLVAGMITGIVILFGGSQRLVVSGLIAVFVQVVTVTLWWLAPTPTARITALILSREWQAIIICVPLGTLATALLLGRRATPAPGQR
jgi:hypothetical protein